MAIAIWQILDSPSITKLICEAGYSHLLIDCEHGEYDPHSLRDCIRLSKNYNTKVIVRFSDCVDPRLLSAIDTGADSILISGIEDTTHVTDAVNSTLLRPKGQRSYSPFVERYHYCGLTKDDDKLEPNIGLLVESKKAIENIEELIVHPDVSYVYFGAYDLSVELGIAGDIFNESIVRMLKKVVQVSTDIRPDFSKTSK